VWNLASSSERDPVNDYCETGCIMTATSASNTSNIIRINGLFPNLISQTSYSAQYTIKNIINPNKVYTQTFSIIIYSSNGNFQNMA
jgi:hypothetical protein